MGRDLPLLLPCFVPTGRSGGIPRGGPVPAPQVQAGTTAGNAFSAGLRCSAMDSAIVLRPSLSSPHSANVLAQNVNVLKNQEVLSSFACLFMAFSPWACLNVRVEREERRGILSSEGC